MEKRASLIFEVFSAAELSSASSRLRHRPRRLSRDILSMKQTAVVVAAARGSLQTDGWMSERRAPL